MNTELLPIIIVSIYMLAMLFVGIITSKKIKTLGDFLVADRQLNFFLATATMFATWFGSESVMGTAGMVYRAGLKSVIADPFGASFVLILAGLFYAVAFRKLQVYTVVDIFNRYYSNKLEFLASLLMIPVYIGWLGAQIVAIGLAFHTFINIKPTLGMTIGAGIVLVYTLSGGMWAVTITDFLQMIILILGIIVLVPFVLHSCGGIKIVFDSTPKNFFYLLPETNNLSSWSTFLGKWCIIGLGCAVGQDLIQRSLSSKTVQIARWSSITAGILYFLVGCIVILIGFAGRIVIPGLENSENLVPLLAKKFLLAVHPVLFGLFISGLLAAIMSSADSSLLAAVSIFCNNIFNRLVPQITDKQLLFVNRVATVVVVLLSISIALYVQQIYNLMVNSWSTLLVSIFTPVTVALYFKKFVDTHACWTSMLTGLFVWLGYIFFTTGSFVINDETMDVFYQASFFGFLSSIAGYLITFKLKSLLKKN